MKKQIKHLLLALGLVAISTNVSAKEISKNEIPENSYVIGNHVFTENTILTTRHIMLASKTIEGNSLNDMIIYYKAPGGTWMEGLAGEELNVPDKFDIYDRDLVEESLKKIGISPMLDTTTGQWLFYPEFDEKTVAETTSGNIKEYEFEIYEKKGSDYTFMGSTTLNPKRGAPVAVDATNEVKTYVGRIALTNSNGEKLYSEYSDEVTVNTKKELVAPELTSNLNIQYKSSEAEWVFDMHLSDEFKNKYSSPKYNFELYEKTDSEYVYIDHAFDANKTGKFAIADISNEVKTYVARLYITNSKGEKIYSDYSEELILDLKNSIPTPKITYHCDINGCSVEILDDYFRTSCINSNNCLPSVADKLIKNYNYNVYEKNGSKVDSGFTYGLAGKTALITNVSNEDKIYVAKLYLTNSKGEEVYSKESNEITISAKDVLGKPVLEYSYEASEGKLYFNLKSDSKYSTLPELAFDYNVELYEIDGESFNLIKTEKYNTFTGGTVMSIIAQNAAKTYVARRVLKNRNNENIYSEYSDELVININEIIPQPVITSVNYSYNQVLNSGVYNINLDNSNIKSTYNSMNFGGFELLEVIDDEIQFENIKSYGINDLIELRFGLDVKKKFVLRAYTLDGEGKRIYSDNKGHEYSEIIIIDPNNFLATPTLSLGRGDDVSGTLTISLSGVYAGENAPDVDGVNVYLKNGTSYSLLCTSDVAGELCNGKLFELNNGQEYVAQTYKKNGIYLYVSLYSNIISSTSET